jgi:hypothetical protein
MMSGAGCTAVAARAGRSSAGFYQMRRGWQDHELFEGDRYCRRAAWEWLIGHSVWRRTVVAIRGTPIPLERGQLCYALRYLAEAWGWTIAQVRGFLAALAKRQMIRTAQSAAAAEGRLVITICNYERYQGRRDAAPNITSAPESHKEETTQEGKNKGVAPLAPHAPPAFAELREEVAASAQPEIGPPPDIGPPADSPRARGTNPRARGSNPRGRRPDPRQPEFFLTISGDPDPDAAASRPPGRRRSPHQARVDAALKIIAARQRANALPDEQRPDPGPGAGLAAAAA